MYLIIEKSRGMYAYRETKRHFKEADKYRKNLTRLDVSALDKECDLAEHGDHFYIVVPIKTTKPKRKTKTAAKKRRK